MKKRFIGYWEASAVDCICAAQLLSFSFLSWSSLSFSAAITLAAVSFYRTFTMSHLSDLQLASMLDEIAAAMRIDAPVNDAIRRLSDRRLGRVASASRKIASALDSGMSNAEAMKTCRSKMMPQATAAILASEKSRDPAILSHLAHQLRSRHEYTRLTRLTWLYPLLLMFIAYMVAVMVMGPVVRSNSGRDFQWSSWVVKISEYLEHGWPVPLAVLVVLTVLFLIWISRGKRLSRPVRQLLFCQSLADQLEHGVNEQEAIGTAAKLSTQRSLENHPNPTLQSAEVRRALASSFVKMPELEGVTSQEVLIARLRYATAIHSERARLSDYRWGTLFPRVAMVAIGGGLTIAYAWWVIRPIYLQVNAW